MNATPTLLELQHALRRALLEGGETAACAEVVADGIEPAQRLAVYRNGYASRLSAALRLCYPAVQRLVGEEFFDGAARVFAFERPPRAAWLDEYGAEFADFLAGFPPAASLAYLPDVARLEWAVNRALHAPEAEPLDVGRLLELNEVQRASVRFAPHPALGLLRTDCPADEIWRAVLARDDAALGAIDPAAGPAWLLVERRDGDASVSRMSEPAWRFAFELCAGRPLHEVLDAACGIEAHSLLAQHFTAGRFVAFTIEDKKVATETSP
ncbi:MAG: DNA-binding domain-containing protein [Betaproteobacteria bacterium]|nr:DNA-binding domain-containing protein [Betaproteobacteria bacterium]